MEYAGELADEGFSILVFPEGVLTRDGSMAAFKPGVGVLARELNLTLLPARIDGAYEVLPVGRWFPRKLLVPVRMRRAHRCRWSPANRPRRSPRVWKRPFGACPPDWGRDRLRARSRDRKSARRLRRRVHPHLNSEANQKTAQG